MVVVMPILVILLLFNLNPLSVIENYPKAVNNTPSNQELIA